MSTVTYTEAQMAQTTALESQIAARDAQLATQQAAIMETRGRYVCMLLSAASYADGIAPRVHDELGTFERFDKTSWRSRARGSALAATSCNFKFA
jgi:hypothetical protein